MAQPSPDALRFLNALGRFDLSDVRVRGFRHRKHPNKGQGRKGGLTTADLHGWQASGHGVYVVVNRGGDEDAEITEAVAMFAEWDDRPLAQQLAFDWAAAGLPEPSIINKTGGKSLHLYWPLSEPCTDLQRWRLNQARLIGVLRSDGQIKNASRVMRLPGYRYALEDGSLGDFIETIHCTEQRFRFEDLEQALTRAEEIAGIDAYASVASEARACGERFEPLLQAMGIRRPKVQPAVRMPEPQPVERGKHTLDEIQRALDCIPPRVPGTGTYDMYRNLFWGLLCAVEEAGYDRQAAIAMMQSHSPEFGEDLDKLARDSNGSVRAGTFWYHAKAYGFRFPRPERTQPPVTRLVEVTETDEARQTMQSTYEQSQDLQSIQANQLLLWLEGQYGERLRFNQLTRRVELFGEPMETDRFYLTLARHGLKVSKELAKDAVLEVASSRAYHPVVEYLDSVSAQVPPADITRLATRYLRPEDASENEPTIYDRMMELTLIAAVARAYRPGCKVDNACVLIGKQGARKSSFWKALAGSWFSDSKLDLRNKDAYMVLHSAWIYEWGELERDTSHAMKAADIRQFVSSATDTFRAPYAAAVDAVPRSGIIVGTSNAIDDLLSDPEGNRRFWCIQTSATEANPLDVQGLLAERDALWSAAVAAYRSGQKWHFEDAGEIEQVTQAASKHMQLDVWAETLSPRISAYSAITVSEAAEILMIPPERRDHRVTLRISRVLKSMGWNCRVERMGRATQRVYRPG